MSFGRPFPNAQKASRTQNNAWTHAFISDKAVASPELKTAGERFSSQKASPPQPYLYVLAALQIDMCLRAWQGQDQRDVVLDKGKERPRTFLESVCSAFARTRRCVSNQWSLSLPLHLILIDLIYLLTLPHTHPYNLEAA